jgi:hypothetical protein
MHQGPLLFCSYLLLCAVRTFTPEEIRASKNKAIYAKDCKVNMMQITRGIAISLIALRASEGMTVTVYFTTVSFKTVGKIFLYYFLTDDSF